MNRTAFTRQALDPRRSVVVEASAGSGKTWLLVSRILRLLLDGVSPSEILAITYTRKAAQEMQSRLREWLRFMASVDDAALQAFLGERGVDAPDLARARNLFDQVLTAQPGLSVQTFHGWFLEILRRAPMSAGGVAGVELTEQSGLLLQEAWQRLSAGLKKESLLYDAYARLISQHGRDCVIRLLEGFVHKRAEWWAFVQGSQNPIDDALQQLAPTSEFPDVRTAVEQLDRPAFIHALEQLCAIYRAGTESLARNTDEIESAMANSDLAVREAQLSSRFFTEKGDLRKTLLSAAEKAGDTAMTAYRLVTETLAMIREARLQDAFLDLNRDGLLCGMALLDELQALKRRMRVVDFTDIEWRVFQMLSDPVLAAFWQAKLDSRYRHVLLDEFQDANPFQWQILERWFTAATEADVRPTVFMVGDPKQSIYRFRRAEARLFDQVAAYLTTHFGAIRLPTHRSYRCAPKILDAVNAVFSAEPTYGGFDLHEAHQTSLAGGVAVLPCIGNAAAAAIASTALRNPLIEPRVVEEDVRHLREAAQLADGIAALVGRLEIAEGKEQRRLRYADIMVLVRRRARLDVYERALRDKGIPYVSTRQGGLLDTLECRDLTNLLKWLTMPYGDLMLAQILKSPLFSCTDDDLLWLHARVETYWWTALHAVPREENPRLARASQLLSHWQSRVDRIPVHDLLDKIMDESDAVARYAACAPQAMRDTIVANMHRFIELALSLDSGRFPSVRKFLRALTELKSARDEDAPDEATLGEHGNAVTIHTIHGAKGLEAPLVWLLDTHSSRRRESGFRAFIDWTPGEEKPALFALYASSKLSPAHLKSALEAEDQLAHKETLNMLYVAMTRAKQWLVVSACDNAQAADSWFGKLATVTGVSPSVEAAFARALCADRQAPETPDVSAAATDPYSVKPVGKRRYGSADRAILHGIAVHQLLEWLAPPAAQPSEDALRARLGALDEAAFRAAWSDAEAILHHPDLQPFFDPAQYLRAVNEFSYAKADGSVRRIDRIVVREEAVWLLDYKISVDPRSESIDALARRYQAQMREYMSTLGGFYPDSPLQAALIFRHGLLFKVPEAWFAQPG